MCAGNVQKCHKVGRATCTQHTPMRDDRSDHAAQASTTFHCNGHKMESATLWLGLAGLLAIAVMMSRSFRGSVFIGIIFVTVIAWIPGHGASYLGAGSPIPGTPLRHVTVTVGG